MARFLGIDYGTKRIGLAVSDPDGRLASPLTTIEARGRAADHALAVLPYVTEYEVEAIVVGLPLNMDDTEGEQAGITRVFGDELARATGVAVHYWDERLSSAAAEELLLPAELTRKKKKARLDRVAAQVMLQSFLDAHATDGDGAETEPAGQ